jgi:hypothetical protein
MTDIVERLRSYASDDHERLCQGREYSCTCGYDEKRDPLLAEAAAKIERLNRELDDVWDALAIQREDNVSFGDAFKRMTSEIERLRAALKPLACTCPAKHQEECSRSEVDCPFWNARGALAEEKHDDL